MRFPFCRNRDSVKNGILISIRRTGDGFHPGLFNGVGIEDLSKIESGYGIRNVKERIQLNYGAEYGVTFESERGKGTTVRITIPEKAKGMGKSCID